MNKTSGRCCDGIGFMNDKGRILVIENDAPSVMMLVNALTQAGCDVQAAFTGAKGKELAQENKFDLIVLSLALPDRSGFEICGELKQRHLTHNTPIVFISRHATIEDQQRALELGAVDFIEMPFSSGDFVSRVLSHMKETSQT